MLTSLDVRGSVFDTKKMHIEASDILVIVKADKIGSSISLSDYSRDLQFFIPLEDKELIKALKEAIHNV